jgi:hypothetical protein
MYSKKLKTKESSGSHAEKFPRNGYCMTLKLKTSLLNFMSIIKSPSFN